MTFPATYFEYSRQNHVFRLISHGQGQWTPRMELTTAGWTFLQEKIRNKWHPQWWKGHEDNLVSWTSSLLFALVYIFHLHANSNDRSAFDDIHLCIIDTNQFLKRFSFVTKISSRPMLHSINT
ncbi:hypothetical protein BKA61DRAFT_605536 [Leptodontidium sp. MPI-SDFR-AT-0119]|nr:hypothetical protein BKA61DRAFT_605536 [Leptodontidium sp. MPI-SDFR-AT-0119]